MSNTIHTIYVFIQNLQDDDEDEEETGDAGSEGADEEEKGSEEESSAGEGSESEEEAAAPAADGGEMGPDYKKKWKKAMFKQTGGKLMSSHLGCLELTR